MREQEINKYFSALKKQLKKTHSPKDVNRIIDIMQRNTDSYFQENPDADFEDFLTEFGDTEELGFDFLENARDLSKLTDSKHFKTKVFKIILGIAIFVILLHYSILAISHLEQVSTEIIERETIIY